MKKRIFALLSAAALLLPCLASLAACGENESILLRVYNWEEYIDEGGEGSYEYDYEINEDGSAPSLVEDFEVWYEETYGTPVTVEYSTFGTNEDMYNQLKLGYTYDLLCPSEYMIMKLAAEDMLEPYSEEFFDESNELNYYVNNVSPFIKEKFDSNTMAVGDGEAAWSEYAAGYMWGTTGLVYNPEYITEEQLELGWALMLDESVAGKVTTKDNVRDSYFVGLAILFEEELLDLKARHEAGELSDADYTAQVTDYMNRTDEETVAKVQQILLEMKENLFGFETDTGKHDMVTGTIWLNFAWSGDAVYAMDVAEDAEDGEGSVTLNYYMPEESANLWFDGWVIPKDDNRTEETKHAAEAFVNFLSAPENAVRNSYYIGYTSVIAGEEMFAYMEDTYSAEEDDETATDYDLSYFFGEGDYIISAPAEQLERQLYAQYPPEEEMLRCAVMDYYGENDERINELWTQIKGETLDAWAIAVICAAVVLIAGFTVYVKLGAKTDFFRPRPKKGYKKVSSVPVSYQK